MNQELKAKWLTALRSGEYKQCKGMLTQDLKAFCCLGVLCDVVSPKGWVKSDGAVTTHENGKLQKIKITHSYEGSKATLPSSIQEKFPKLDCHKLMVLNDREGYTFKQIADEIEKM